MNLDKTMERLKRGTADGLARAARDVANTDDLEQLAEFRQRLASWEQQGFNGGVIFTLLEVAAAKNARNLPDKIDRLETWLTLSDQALLALEKGENGEAHSLLTKVATERMGHGWDPLAYPLQIKRLKDRIAELEAALKFKVYRDLALYGNAVDVRKNSEDEESR